MTSKKALPPCEGDPYGLGWHRPVYSPKTGHATCHQCGVIIWSAT